MNKFINKSIYIEYFQCAKNAWLKLHKKQELQDFFAQSAIMNKENLVGLWDRKLFSNGIIIEEYDEDVALITKSYIEQQPSVLFQSTFYHDRLLVRNDILRTGNI